MKYCECMKCMKCVKCMKCMKCVKCVKCMMLISRVVSDFGVKNPARPPSACACAGGWCSHVWWAPASWLCNASGETFLGLFHGEQLRGV